MATIENLKHFVAVVEYDGVINASKSIFISASSLTRSIQQIESDVGYKMFDRNGKKIRLTNTGRSFYERTLILLQQFEYLFIKK